MSDYDELRAENAKVLRKLAKELDLSIMTEVDFAVAFPEKAQALKAAEYINKRARGSAIRARVVAVEDEFECAFTVRMVPTLKDITDIEIVLSEASDQFDGYETTWGLNG